MPKIAALGWYGHNNIGDTLLLEALKQLFKEYTIAPFSNEQTPIAPKVDITEINKCDLFVLGGGELICPDRLFVYNPTLPRIVRAGMWRIGLNITSWINKIKIPKIILGCGVEAETPDELTKSLIKELEQFSYIGLRDKKAVELLKSFKQLEDKVHLFYDLAFSINLPSINVKVNKDLASVIPTERPNTVNSEAWLKDKLSEYEKTTFLAFGTEDNNDYKTCEQLSRCANDFEIIPYNQLTLETLTKHILEADKVFSYRLHGMLLAFMLGKPYEYYAYHRKLDRNHETINNISPDKIRFIQKQELFTVTNR